MPRISEGHIAIGGLILFAAWLFIGLPWLLLPLERIEYRENSKAAAYGSEKQPDGTSQSPFFVQVIPAPKSAQERADEADDREEKKYSDRWLVRWTAALGVATVGLLLATGVLGYFAYTAIGESRRIGEAQVRAYVSIKSAAIGFGTPREHPWVQFVAFNTGQSPARNFIWNITVQYASGHSKRTRPFNANWINEKGLDIPAASDAHPDRAVIANMSLRDFREVIDQTIARGIVVRIKIDYRYTDIFEQFWFGESFFSEIAHEVPNPDDTGFEPINIRALFPMPSPKDWEG